MSTFSCNYLDVPLTSESALALLHPALACWFRQRFGLPTQIQRLTWSALAQARHVLVSAPTGTGKTLAAFLPVLGDLLQGSEPQGASESPLQVVYVAPLKALVNDAARGLERLLGELKPLLPAGVSIPRLAIRTGDSTPAERRHLREHPPEILLTTPESLAVLLSLTSSGPLLANVRWILVDEVHALAGNKRGADLAVSLERLEHLVTHSQQLGDSSSPPLRRVGLSATATPLEVSARWLVSDRPCTLVRAPSAAPPVLHLELLPEGVPFLHALIDRLVQALPPHRAVLIFSNTRALAERLAWALRRRLPAWDDLIAAHHSALAPHRRQAIEARFKRGELRVVVCSTSLELGIDPGTVDLVVLVHPPGDVVRLLQRVGRAGHQPGGIAQGLILSATPGECLEAAVTAASSRSGQCEPLHLPLACPPLDVLCQQILGMCCARPTPAAELFDLLRRAAPFAHLSRQDFDDCLAYLLGRDKNGENWLPSRLAEDGDCLRIESQRTARLFRRNLGTILADPTVPVHLRTACAREDVDDPVASDTTQPIGEIDESFADRLQPGDRFLLDGRCLEYRCREDQVALVEQVVGRPRIPIWMGDAWPLSLELAQRVYTLRLQAGEALREGLPALEKLLRDQYELTGPVVTALANYFEQQEAVSEIPDVTTLLVEKVQTDRDIQYYFHTPLARPANDALARVAVWRLGVANVGDALRGVPVQAMVADLGFVLVVRSGLADFVVRTLLRAEGFREALDASLVDSDLLRSRFARVAQTGFMVLRNPQGRRRKVGGTTWPQRELFDQVRRQDARLQEAAQCIRPFDHSTGETPVPPDAGPTDFCLLRQAYREIHTEVCDLDAALAYVQRLERLTIRVRTLQQPSPFASAWSPARQDDIIDQPRSRDEALARLYADLQGSDHVDKGMVVDAHASGGASADANRGAGRSAPGL